MSHHMGGSATACAGIRVRDSTVRVGHSQQGVYSCLSLSKRFGVTRTLRLSAAQRQLSTPPSQQGCV